jgi:hypothetical protein
MNNKIAQIRQSLRNVKNNAFDRYYQFRIDGCQNPYQVLFKSKAYKILFVLSHMRSGSSLLAHILISNSEEVIGYGETHITYSSEADFKQLIFKVYRKTQALNMEHKYILDKVLFKNKFVNENLLLAEQVYVIFLIREAAKSLSSLLALKPHWTEEQALHYYCERLATLEKYAKLINNKKRSFFITYDLLLQNTNLVFDTFKNFLDTENTFSEEYRILKTTGMRGIGDWQGNIKAGRIVRDPRNSEHKISQDSIEKAREYFARCSQTLSEYCRTVKS